MATWSKELYKSMKSQKLEDILKTDPKEVGKNLEQFWAKKDSKKSVVTKGQEAGAGVFIKLVAKVAHQYSEEEFCKFVESGELPAIKLSKQEMNAMKGGFIPLLWRSSGRIGAETAGRGGGLGDAMLDGANHSFQNWDAASSWLPMVLGPANAVPGAIFGAIGYGLERLSPTPGRRR